MKPSFDCCYNCVTPKRHEGCHGHCEEYIKEKERIKQRNEYEKKNKHHTISKSEFDANLNYRCYNGSKPHKRRGTYGKY